MLAAPASKRLRIPGSLFGTAVVRATPNQRSQ